MVLSTDWFSVIRYTPGAVLDGPILDISDDGSLFLFGGGASTPLVLNVDTREVVRLAQGTTPARISGNGQYVVHALAGDCLFDRNDCDSAENERALVDITTGETKNLGGMFGRVLINESGTVVMGLLHPTQGPELNETVEWSNGTITMTRTLYAELGDSPERVVASPQLLDLDGTGTKVLYRPWVGSGPLRGPTYSLLIADGSVGVIGDEMFSLGNRGLADLSEDGELFLLGTDHGLMTVEPSNGTMQHYRVESPGRVVLTYALAGERLLAATGPDFESTGPTNLISFDRGDGPFDQSAELLVTIAESFPSESPVAPRLWFETSADGTAAGLSILVDDPSHADGSSWVSIIIDLENVPGNSYIGTTDDGSIVESSTTPSSNPQESGQSAAQYLASTYDIAADSVGHQLLINLSGAELEEFGDLWRNARDRVQALSPPPALAPVHDRWATILGTFADELDEFGKVVESTDPAEAERGTERYLAATGSLRAELAEIDRVQLDATIETLSMIDTPDAAYLSRVLDVQRGSDAPIEAATNALSEIATNPDAALRNIVDALGLLKLQFETLDQFEVPPAATALHQRRSEALGSMTEALDEIATSLQSGSELSAFVVLRLNALVGETPELNAAWSRYVAAVLREQA